MNDGQDAQQDIASTLYEYIASFDREIYANEERREDSLIQQATNMQTAFSFVSAAVFMVAPIVIEYRGKLPLEFFLIVFALISGLLLACLFCATKAQKRMKRHILPAAQDFQNLVETQYCQFETEEQREKYIAETYGKLHQSLEKSNDKRVFWIQLSMWLFYGTLGICVISFIIAMPILFL